MKNPYLVIIDIQEKLFPVISNKDALLKKIEILIKGFQLFRLPIIITEQVPDKLGPTIEPIDSIRYLTNHSSGKQGYEIAQQMILSGAKVILVSGPTNLEPPFNSKIIRVKTANEMFNAVKKNLNVDIAIFTAAVADVSPQNILKTKIQKNELTNIKLKKNKDILYEVANLKKNRPKIVIGFAAETNNHINNAKKKLLNKNCDAIVVNKIDKKNQVFGSDFNKVSFVTKKTILNFNKTSKINVAKKVIRLIDSLQ